MSQFRCAKTRSGAHKLGAFETELGDSVLRCEYCFAVVAEQHPTPPPPSEGTKIQSFEKVKGGCKHPSPTWNSHAGYSQCSVCHVRWDSLGLDAVNHPKHYGGEGNPYEAIKVIEAWGLGFSLGNTAKYIARAGKKDGASPVEDLKKAAWYLNRAIEEAARGAK